VGLRGPLLVNTLIPYHHPSCAHRPQCFHPRSMHYAASFTVVTIFSLGKGSGTHSPLFCGLPAQRTARISPSSEPECTAGTGVPPMGTRISRYAPQLFKALLSIQNTGSKQLQEPLSIPSVLFRRWLSRYGPCRHHASGTAVFRRKGPFFGCMKLASLPPYGFTGLTPAKGCALPTPTLPNLPLHVAPKPKWPPAARTLTAPVSGQRFWAQWAALAQQSRLCPLSPHLERVPLLR